jgi:UMF1 family MFS transporter
MGTVREVAGARGDVARFLVAYWLYIDGVDTVIRMAVDYGLSLGLPTRTLIAALLLTQFVGFPAAVAFGRFGQHFGSKTGILVGLTAYVGITAWGARMTRPWEFFALAVMVVLVQGGVQALSRAFYARLVPPERSAEYFGFYNMLGKFAVVLGPTLMGLTGLVTGSARASIVAVALLWRVRAPA